MSDTDSSATQLNETESMPDVALGNRNAWPASAVPKTPVSQCVINCTPQSSDSPIDGTNVEPEVAESAVDTPSFPGIISLSFPTMLPDSTLNNSNNPSTLHVAAPNPPPELMVSYKIQKCTKHQNETKGGKQQRNSYIDQDKQ
jgi:hypothetical protein